MGHLVITIGCEYGAKGNAIGRKIAEDLGIIAILLISANSRCVEPPFAIVRTYCF